MADLFDMFREKPKHYPPPSVPKSLPLAQGPKQGETQYSIGGSYPSMMGTPQAPQNHPANNVVHPHGNRGLEDSSLSMYPPLNTPNSGAYQEDY